MIMLLNSINRQAFVMERQCLSVKKVLTTSTLFIRTSGFKLSISCRGTSFETLSATDRKYLCSFDFKDYYGYMSKAQNPWKVNGAAKSITLFTKHPILVPIPSHLNSVPALPHQHHSSTYVWNFQGGSTLQVCSSKFYTMNLSITWISGFKLLITRRAYCYSDHHKHNSMRLLYFRNIVSESQSMKTPQTIFNYNRKSNFN